MRPEPPFQPPTPLAEPPRVSVRSTSAPTDGNPVDRPLRDFDQRHAEPLWELPGAARLVKRREICRDLLAFPIDEAHESDHTHLLQLSVAIDHRVGPVHASSGIDPRR